MIKKQYLLGILFVLMYMPAGLVWAEPAADMIVVVAPHTRVMPPGVPNSGAFFALKNFDDRDHALIRAESMIAKSVELHTHMMDEGVARMREVERIDIPAGGRTELAPGGFHVMLIGLNQPIREGTKVLLTLTFEDGSKKTIVAPGRTIQSGGMPHHHH